MTEITDSPRIEVLKQELKKKEEELEDLHYFVRWLKGVIATEEIKEIAY